MTVTLVRFGRDRSKHMNNNAILLALVAFGFATMCFIGKSIERLLAEIRDELRRD
jgi:hypothetical protein